MTDETQGSEPEERGGPLAGERLKAARREREISVVDIAKELHLDEMKVRALENNQFDVLGAPVFAKGHLRKYAELVGVPIDDILADYYALNRSVGAPPVVGKPRKVERDINLGPWIVAVIVIAVIGGAVYWWLGRGGALPDFGGIEDSGVADDEPTIELAMPPPQDATDGPVDDSASTSVPEAVPEPITVEPQADEIDAAPETTQPIAASAEPAGPSVTLAMSFSGDCWTEVTDSAGERLYFDLGREGRTISVSGTPPLRVLFGNSDNVSLAVDGSDYPIPASMRRGQTARLTINNQ